MTGGESPLSAHPKLASAVVTRAATGTEQARRDDLRQGRGERYTTPRRVHVAAEPAEVPAVLQDIEAAARAGAWCVGYVSYEAAPAFDARMRVHPADPTLPLAMFVEFAECRPVPPVARPAVAPGLTAARLGGRSWFVDAVDAVREAIAAGAVYQVNLTDRIRGSYTGSPADLYAHLCHRQHASGTLLLETDDVVVACASPELFFAMESGTITAKPMKGTARRAARFADDEAAAAALRASAKDRAENVMIVDLLRNDLSRLAVPFGVTVASLFDVERYETVWQMVSTIRAQVPETVTVADVFAALFPCGSVTGAPKIAAMDHIEAAETWPRGPYCGAVGVVEPHPDGVAARFQVGIRTALLRPAAATLEYGSGGGITWDSDAGQEDDELTAKALVLDPLAPDFSLIETLRVDHRGAVNWPHHRRRLCASAAYFGFVLDTAALEDLVDEAVRAAQGTGSPQRLRLLVSRDGRLDREMTPLVELPTIVRVAVAERAVHSADPFACHKTTHRGVYDRARRWHPDADDVLLGNERGEIVESTIANVVYRLGGHWYVPPLTSGGLDGVGRRLLLDDGVVTERVLLVEEVAQCEAIELVSSLRGRRRAILDIAAP